MRGVSIKTNAAIRAALAELRQQHGNLTEEAIVAASKVPTSPLHGMFLWDNPDKAAHVGRLEIARQLIMSVRILPSEAKALNISVETRKYHGRVGGGYADILDVVTQDSMRKQLLAAALRDLESFEAKYKALSELQPVFNEIRKLKRERTRKAG